jgi:hypothetical protein
MGHEHRGPTETSKENWSTMLRDGKAGLSAVLSRETCPGSPPQGETPYGSCFDQRANSFNRAAERLLGQHSTS